MANTTPVDSEHESGCAEEPTAVKYRLNKLEQDRRGRKSRVNLLVTIEIIFALSAVFTIFIGLNNSYGVASGIFGFERWRFLGLCVYLSMLCLVMVVGFDRMRNLVEATIEDLDFEIDLLRFPVAAVQIRAEKTLLQHNKQLRRYYALNLGENEKIFWVGIGCIVFGVLIICLTVYLVVFQVRTDKESKVIVAVLGAIGSILTNYIAATYLRMHAAAAANLAKFHGRLVETHHVMFSNLVASRIENDKVRWDTLSKVAVEVANPLKSEPKEKETSGRRRKAGRGSGDTHHDSDEEEDEQEETSEAD